MFKTMFELREAVQLRDKIIGTLYPELNADARVRTKDMTDDELLSLTADIVDFLIEQGIIVGGEVPEPAGKRTKVVDGEH